MWSNLYIIIILRLINLISVLWRLLWLLFPEVFWTFRNSPTPELWTWTIIIYPLQMNSFVMNFELKLHNQINNYFQTMKLRIFTLIFCIIFTIYLQYFLSRESPLTESEWPNDNLLIKNFTLCRWHCRVHQHDRDRRQNYRHIIRLQDLYILGERDISGGPTKTSLLVGWEGDPR